jgi:transcription elongation factor Elf1
MRSLDIMNLPEKPQGELSSEAEIDERYGLEPVLRLESTTVDPATGSEFATVHCPYCGEAFETRVDTSAGSATYVEDCQVCCQPIEMRLRVADDGTSTELIASRGDS